MADLAEVALPEPEEDRAVELCLPADVVVLAGTKGLSVLVVPRLVRLVLVAHEDCAAIPVVGLAAQVVAALEQQDALARGREPVGEGAAAAAAADDDHVVVAAHSFVQIRATGEVHAPVAPRSFGWVSTSANSFTPSRASSAVLRFSTTKTPWMAFSRCGTSNGLVGSSAGTGP